MYAYSVFNLQANKWITDDALSDASLELWLEMMYTLYMLLWGTLLLSHFRSYSNELAYDQAVLGLGTQRAEPIREQFVLQQRRHLDRQHRYLGKVCRCICVVCCCFVGAETHAWWCMCWHRVLRTTLCGSCSKSTTATTTPVTLGCTSMRSPATTHWPAQAQTIVSTTCRPHLHQAHTSSLKTPTASTLLAVPVALVLLSRQHLCCGGGSGTASDVFEQW